MNMAANQKAGHYYCVPKKAVLSALSGFPPMRKIEAIILAVTLACSAGAQDRAISSEETQVIEKTRGLVLEYTETLKNFICTETVHRSQLQKGSQKWKALDTLAVAVELSDRGERYKLLTINGKPTQKKLSEVGGAISDGDFGSILQWIFQLESKTKFQAERSSELRGRPMHVFSYRIEQNHSKFKVNDTITAFGGLIFLDRETSRVMRITAAASGLPADWAITAFSQEQDYGFAEISGQKFWLPVHGDLSVTVRDGSRYRNELEFGNYRRFSSETTLQSEPQ
jgi:hypothetical protein